MKNVLNKWLGVGGSTESELVVKVIEKMEIQWRRAEILELCHSVRMKSILSISESKRTARECADTIEILILEDADIVKYDEDFDAMLLDLRIAENSLFNNSYSSRGNFK